GNPLLDSRHILFRHNTTNNFVYKLKPLSAFICSRLKTNPTVPILTTTARLPNKFALNLTLITNCFAVSYLRLTDIRINAKFSAHTINDDIEVQLTHTTNNCLPCFFISFNAKGRILLSQFTQS